MRVITGSAKGRRLKELAGMETRPTTDRVKEGLFNIIQFDIEGRRVLDLFAGTGQMGLEAISRGAKSVTFVESGRPSLEALRQNVQAFDAFTAQIQRQWRGHRTLLGFAMDHGCHEIDGGCGSHGLDMQEDMNIIHMFSFIK